MEQNPPFNGLHHWGQVLRWAPSCSHEVLSQAYYVVVESVDHPYQMRPLVGGGLWYYAENGWNTELYLSLPQPRAWTALGKKLALFGLKKEAKRFEAMFRG